MIGLVLNAAITYSGLKIGFTLGGSAIAAVLGWGVLRGLLRKGSIIENNVAQTIASSVNTSNSGVIFTVPVLFLLGLEFDEVWLGAACAAGAILGVAFIIPTRKQMIDFDRLRFPTGTAVATVLRSPGEGVKKAYILMAGIAVSMIVFFFSGWPDVAKALGLSEAWQFGYQALGDALGGEGQKILTDSKFDLGKLIGLPATIEFKWAIVPFAIGAGYITGAPGLVVLAGGVLAYHLITPIAFESGWMPTSVTPDKAGGWASANMNRPIGIGLLMGGAFMGLVFAFPAIGAAFKGMQKAAQSGREREELPLGILYVAAAAAFLLLFFAARGTLADGNLAQSALIAAVGTVWIWFSGIVIAQCTGMTDWSPISGMALLTVMICLLLTGNQVLPAVTIGAAVCVAITLSADMMQDLKTGHMVGGLPIRQQFLEICTVWIGPLVALAVVFLLAKSNMDKFGEPFAGNTDTPAAQAAALQAAIDGLRGGDAPVHLYGMGALMGALLSMSPISGLGVLVGLSMYLPLVYLLPYGLGCVIQMFTKKFKGQAWTENWGVPFAAGLLVGEGLLGVIFAAIQVAASSGGA